MAQGQVARAGRAVLSRRHREHRQLAQGSELAQSLNRLLLQAISWSRVGPEPEEAAGKPIVRSIDDQPQLIGLQPAQNRNGQVRDDGGLRILLPVDGVGAPTIGFEPQGCTPAPGSTGPPSRLIMLQTRTGQPLAHNLAAKIGL